MQASGSAFERQRPQHTLTLEEGKCTRTVARIRKSLLPHTRADAVRSAACMRLGQCLPAPGWSACTWHRMVPCGDELHLGPSESPPLCAGAIHQQFLCSRPVQKVQRNRFSCPFKHAGISRSAPGSSAHWWTRRPRSWGGRSGRCGLLFRGFEIPPGLKPWSFAHEFLQRRLRRWDGRRLRRWDERRLRRWDGRRLRRWDEREVRHLLPRVEGFIS